MAGRRSHDLKVVLRPSRLLSSGGDKEAIFITVPKEHGVLQAKDSGTQYRSTVLYSSSTVKPAGWLEKILYSILFQRNRGTQFVSTRRNPNSSISGVNQR